jgi:hypothetical protein
MEWTSDLESPPAFRTWVGLSVLAGALGRRVFVRGLGKKLTYPNLYVVLVAPPGRCRKGEAMDAGVGLLRDWREYLRVLAGKLTTPGLYDALQQESQIRPEGSASIYIYASEFTATVSTDADMARFFRDMNFLWDPEDDFDLIQRNRRSASGEFIPIRNHCLNFLGGTTPDELGAVKGSSMVGGGFASRTIFVVRYTPGQFVGRTLATEEDRRREVNIRGRLSADLGHIITTTSLQGEIHGTEDAWNWYVEWRRQAEEMPPTDERLLHYHSRKPKHIWKLAMLLSIAESDCMVIERRHIEAALRLIEDIEPTMSDVYAGMADTEHERLVRTVYSEILRNGSRINVTELSRRMSHKIERTALARLITHMRACGLITIDSVTTGNGPQAVITALPLGGQSCERIEGEAITAPPGNLI